MVKLRKLAFTLAAGVALTVGGFLASAESASATCPGSQVPCYNLQFDWEMGCIVSGDECLGCCFKKTE